MSKTTSDLDAAPGKTKLGGPVSVTRPALTGSTINKLSADALGGGGTISRDVIADPRKEYVASGGYSWLTHYLRSLPLPIDDLAASFGADIYERMLLDTQVASKFNTFKLGVLAQDITFLPVEDNKDDSQPRPFGKGPRQSSATAKEIADFCNRQMDNLVASTGRSLQQTCMELLDGAALGNKVAELIYDIAPTGQDAGRLILRAIKTKPRSSTAFVVDAFFNVIGLLGLIPGQGYPIIVEGIMGTPDQVPNLLPREKFIIFTWDSRDGDPRGNSILRSAYDPWWLKQQIKAEHIKYLAQFAGPSLVGVTAEDAQTYQPLNADGTIAHDVYGNPLPALTPEAAMSAQLTNVQNGSNVVVPFGADVRPLSVGGNGEAFLKAIDLYNEEIAKGILLQALATEEGQHQARASSETQQDVLSLLFRYGRKALAWTLWRDLLRILVRANWGDDALPLTPVVSLGDNEHYDFAANVTALGTVGYTLDPTQFDAIDGDMGLPARAPDWLAAHQAAQKAQIQASQQVGQDGDKAQEGQAVIQNANPKKAD